jgi:hypothetical protein
MPITSRSRAIWHSFEQGERDGPPPNHPDRLPNTLSPLAKPGPASAGFFFDTTQNPAGRRGFSSAQAGDLTYSKRFTPRQAASSCREMIGVSPGEYLSHLGCMQRKLKLTFSSDRAGPRSTSSR